MPRTATKQHSADKTKKAAPVLSKVGAKSESKKTLITSTKTSVIPRMKNIHAMSLRRKSSKKDSGKQCKNLSKENLAKHDELNGDEKLVEKKRNRYWIKSKWSGNSDDEGSVDSGILEENICFHCGISTSSATEWSNVVLCDRCDGEYHLDCVGLESVPRISFTCPRCQEEIAAYSKLSCSFRGEKFKIPLKKNCKIEYCFSPSKPLKIGWNELLEKYFMLVSKVFPLDVLKKLLFGPIENVTHSGRKAECWNGAVKEFDNRLKSSVKNLINRGGRFDLQLPQFVVSSLNLTSFLEPIINQLKTIMGNPAPQIRTQNIIFVPYGSPIQDWHCDDSMHVAKKPRYFTILIHLNPIDIDCGGTEIWSRNKRSCDLIRGRPGDAFVFSGSLLHRGHANNGRSHRFFYYASFSCKEDANMMPMM